MHDNEWIRAVEILPAAETLYLQYLKLDNKEAKEYIDSVSKLYAAGLDSFHIIDKSNFKHKKVSKDFLMTFTDSRYDFTSI